MGEGRGGGDGAPDIPTYRARLRCSAAGIDEIFPGCLDEARRLLTPAGIEAWLDGASTVCGLGRGQDLPLIFLEAVPRVAHRAGEAVIGEITAMTQFLSRAGSPRAIGPFLGRLPAVTQRLETAESLAHHFDLVRRLAQEAPEGLLPFLEHADGLLAQLSIGGLGNWVDYGLRTYRRQRHRAGDYFSLQTADARAVLQRERHGTLLADHERKLALYLHSFWEIGEPLQPYSLAFDLLRRPRPHLDKQGFHVPDVLEDSNGVAGLDRYRATLAHLAAHRLWTKPLVADNFNPYQQLLIETFEDARVEALAMDRYPGLRRLWLALHPRPRPGDCPPGHSCIRFEAAMLSRALLDPQHGYTAPALLDAVARFHAGMAGDPHDPQFVVQLAVDYLVQIQHPDFRSPQIHFRDTEVGYRDDNRYLWIFLEDSDDEDDFHSDHHVANPEPRDAQPPPPAGRHQREWDYETGSYRPDWATVYDSLPAPGDAARIDAILARHAALARRLRRVVDLLKPQGRVRIRFQEDGSELDVDAAVRSLVDLRGGGTPDPRIHFSNTPDDRDIAVLLLLDLSESIKATPAGASESLLELTRQAVALLGATLAALGDPLAIAGFASNGRHEVHHVHFKDFDEAWDETVKTRLAGMGSALSTRMGAALRHAGARLAAHPAEKRLLLLLTDGEPADVDVDDPEYLHADARRAVEELAGLGVTTFCMSLDPGADAYVRRIFGPGRYDVLDRVNRLPERLSALYLGLTR